MPISIRLVAIGLATAGCYASYPVAAQQAVASEQEQRASRALDSMRSMLFRAIPAEAPTRDRGLAYQVAHMAGREDLSVAAMQGTGPCIAADQDPIAAIVAEARRTNIVIINEDHGSPRHRQFVADVLKALRPEGYSIYAAEAFTREAPGHAPLYASDGFYTQEPIFGRTVQLAKSLGYELVAYEAGGNSLTGREEAQKDNLIAAIFRDRPAAKTIIHVGGAHLLERPVLSQGNTKWMAAHLIDATGINPLTISQLGCLSDQPASVLAAAGRNGNDVTTPEDAGVDIFVGHPKVEYRDHRPVWRRDVGDVEVDVPETFASKTDTVIVEARPIGTSAATVPIDRILIRPNERLPLLLPPGRYWLDAFVPTGKVNPEPLVIDTGQ
jgi:hypothetical protein